MALDHDFKIAEGTYVLLSSGIDGIYSFSILVLCETLRVTTAPS